MKKSVTALLIVDAQQGLLEGEQAAPACLCVLSHARRQAAFFLGEQEKGQEQKNRMEGRE